MKEDPLTQAGKKRLSIKRCAFDFALSTMLLSGDFVMNTYSTIIPYTHSNKNTMPAALNNAAFNDVIGFPDLGAKVHRTSLSTRFFLMCSLREIRVNSV